MIDYVFKITKEDPQYLSDVIRGYVVETEKELDTLLKMVTKNHKGFTYEAVSKKEFYAESNYRQYQDQLNELAFDLVRNQKMTTPPNTQTGSGFCKCIGKKKCNKPIYKGTMAFDNIKWGSLTKQFNTYKKKHPSIATLDEFAHYIMDHKNEFRAPTIKRAEFYVNVIKGKGQAHGKPVLSDAEKLKANEFANELMPDEKGISFGDVGLTKKQKKEQADAFIKEKQKQIQKGKGNISNNNIMPNRRNEQMGPPSRSYGPMPMMGYGGGGIHHHYHFHEPPSMEGQGFFDDVGKFFTHTIPSAAKSAGQEIEHFGTQTLPSTLIHQGIPVAGSVLGGVAGEALAPEGGPVSGFIGSQIGKQAGNMIADKLGSSTGYGLKLQKGSAAAKAWGEKMRQARLAKKKH